MFGCFWTNGQICSATSRLLLHENIADQFIKLLVAEASAIVVGDPLDRDNLTRVGMLGPVATAQQYNKVTRCIQSAVDQGAEIYY